MEEAIKLAIEGGWRKNFPAQCSWNQYEHTFLDPLFWQALGRARGWENKSHPYAILHLVEEYGMRMNDTEGILNKRIKPWLYHALRFFELKLTGDSEEKFWKDLLNN